MRQRQVVSGQLPRHKLQWIKGRRKGRTTEDERVWYGLAVIQPADLPDSKQTLQPLHHRKWANLQYSSMNIIGPGALFSHRFPSSFFTSSTPTWILSERPDRYCTSTPGNFPDCVWMLKQNNYLISLPSCFHLKPISLCSSLMSPHLSKPAVYPYVL